MAGVMGEEVHEETTRLARSTGARIEERDVYKERKERGKILRTANAFLRCDYVGFFCFSFSSFFLFLEGGSFSSFTHTQVPCMPTHLDINKHNDDERKEEIRERSKIGIGPLGRRDVRAACDLRVAQPSADLRFHLHMRPSVLTLVLERTVPYHSEGVEDGSAAGLQAILFSVMRTFLSRTASTHTLGSYWISVYRKCRPLLPCCLIGLSYVSSDASILSSLFVLSLLRIAILCFSLLFRPKAKTDPQPFTHRRGNFLFNVRLESALYAVFFFFSLVRKDPIPSFFTKKYSSFCWRCCKLLFLYRDNLFLCPPLAQCPTAH